MSGFTLPLNSKSGNSLTLFFTNAAKQMTKQKLIVDDQKKGSKEYKEI